MLTSKFIGRIDFTVIGVRWRSDGYDRNLRRLEVACHSNCNLPKPM